MTYSRKDYGRHTMVDEPSIWQVMEAAGIAIENVIKRPHDGLYALNRTDGQVVFGPKRGSDWKWFAQNHDHVNAWIDGELTSNRAGVLTWVAERQDH